MRLVSLGLPGKKTVCDAPDQAPIDRVRVTGGRWYTSFGLRVGDSVAGLRRLYPRASFHRRKPGFLPDSFWLVTRRAACIGLCGNIGFVPAPVLVAEVASGRVRAFQFVVGAQGE